METCAWTKVPRPNPTITGKLSRILVKIILERQLSIMLSRLHIPSGVLDRTRTFSTSELSLASQTIKDGGVCTEVQ